MGTNLKIVVTGAFRSGKTRFCETISDKNLHKIADKESELMHHCWDVAISEDVTLNLFDTPNSLRLSFTREVLDDNESGMLLGFIVLIDAARTETFRESNSIIQTLLIFSPFPVVIAANKQDIYGAWDAESLRVLLRIPPQIPIVPCVATDKKSVANVLIALGEEVLRDIDADEAET